MSNEILFLWLLFSFLIVGWALDTIRNKQKVILENQDTILKNQEIIFKNQKSTAEYLQRKM